MDTSVKVQHSKHFKFDPAKQNIGAIVLPETVMLTIAVGEEIVSEKLPLNEAFTAEEQAKLIRQLEPLVVKAHQVATHVSTTPDLPVAPSGAPEIPQNPTIDDEEGESLF